MWRGKGRAGAHPGQGNHLSRARLPDHPQMDSFYLALALFVMQNNVRRMILFREKINTNMLVGGSKIWPGEKFTKGGVQGESRGPGGRRINLSKCTKKRQNETF